MAKKLNLVLAVVGLIVADVNAAHCGGLRSRLSARRAARAARLHEIYPTPQAAWNAYYRAMVGRDWDTAYRALDHDSRKHAVAGAAFAVLWFSGEDGHGGAAESLARRHRISLAEMIRDFNEAAESRLSAPHETSALIYDEESRALIETQANLLRHIPNHAAFYRDAMTAILATAAEDAPIHGEQPPNLTEVRLQDNRARALYRTDAASARRSEVSGERTIDFTFEDGGWKVRELAW